MAIQDTLKKITYDNLEQFVEDLNHNFGVFKNSPLYKGIPGDTVIGLPGLQGIRGSQFIFVNFEKFQLQFPNEFVNSSAITLNYINTKLLNFADKQKLLIALEVTEFVDKDIIILTNSIMLSYDINNNIFLSTNIAFNSQINLVTTIEQQIEYYVQYYINSNQTILGLKNIFESYSTYAKNYADTSNVYITNQQTASSVYVPYYPGLTTNTNGTLVNHKYFGLNDTEFGRNGNGSVVFGSLKKYIDLLTATVSLSDGVTLTSDYAPGASNIPIAIFLQDTSNAGLMIGRKIKANLSSFAHIYKNSLDELVIKSDSGPDTVNNIPSLDFSRFVLGKNKMSFDKNVIFGGNLSVGSNFVLVGDIDNKYIRTGPLYTTEDKVDILEVGSIGTGAKFRNVSDIIRFNKYIDKILVTDISGTISQTYSLETTQMNTGQEVAFIQISPIPTLNTKIPTSNYLGFLMRKINNISTKITTDYYKKANFGDGSIPGLLLSDFLTVTKNVILGGNETINMFNININTNKTIIGKNSDSITNILGIPYLINNPAKVLITDVEGKILSTYKLTDKTQSGTVTDSYASVPMASTNDELLIPDNIGTRSEFDILSGYQNSWIIKVINSVKTRLKNTFNKTESDTRYLQKESNLNDLPNKILSRTNLDVYSKTEVNTFGQKLLMYLKIDGYNIPHVLNIKKPSAFYDYYPMVRRGIITGRYEIYFRTNAGAILGLNNYFVLATCFDGGNEGELVTGITKCSIGNMTTPSIITNGQINISLGDDNSGNNGIFELYIYEFLI
jgi:hypothetical protein